MNQAEQVVSHICKKSFLSFWSFPNPVREDNQKELTDIIVVNDPYVILISVKGVTIKDSGDRNVDSQRWYNRAIKKSYDQLYGAERIISQRITKIRTADKKYELQLPEVDAAQIFRIGISIGRHEDFALPFGRFETGFVHFDL